MNDRPDGPVSGPAVWKGADYRDDDSWVHVLSEAEIADLEQALEGLGPQALREARFERSDFPLGTLGPVLEEILAQVQEGRGFALIRGLPLERWSRQQIDAAYWGIGAWLGAPISQNAQGHLIAEVTDRGHSYATSVNDRGYRSRDALNPHVDTSDITALLCLRPAKSGGHSSIASSLAIYNEILVHHPEHMDSLLAGYHHDLRGEGPTGELDEVTRNRIPVFSSHKGRLSCCYNDKIIRSAHDKMGEPLGQEDEAALACVLETAHRSDIRLDMWLERGDIQLINNYVLLHWRTAFEDFVEADKRRCLLRLWLNTHEPRPLAADFADRYNTGPRGGVWVDEANAVSL